MLEIALCVLTLGLACPSNSNYENPNNQAKQVQTQQSVQEVPEPATIIGSVLAAGIGYSIKKHRKPV